MARNHNLRLALTFERLVFIASREVVEVMNYTLSTLKWFFIICFKAIHGPIKASLIFIGSLSLTCFIAWLVGFVLTDHRAFTPYEILKAIERGIFITAITAASGVFLYTIFFVLPDVIMEKWREASRKVAEKQGNKNE